MDKTPEQQKLEKKQSVQKMLKVVLIIAASLVLLAVIAGVCNALFADGAWTFGWTNYRYDDSAYEVGDGTVPADNVQRIDIDWVDGIIQILPCDDRYISLTESAGSELSEGSEVRWRVLEDGTLSVKYRSSSWFLGSGSGKNLTLRVPRELLEQMQSVHVKADSANVYLKEVTSVALSVETVSGDLRMRDCACDALNLHTKTGDLDFEGMYTPVNAQIELGKGSMTFALPGTSDFTLYWTGEISSDLPLTKGEGTYICGEGTSQLSVTSKNEKGHLNVTVYQPE